MTRIARFALLGAALNTLALAPPAPQPTSEGKPGGQQFVERVRKPLVGAGEHTVVFPTFVPSTLTLTYAGIRVGGVSESATYRPFQTLEDTYQQVTGFGAVDVSKLVIRDFAVRTTATGSVTTGVNVGTLVSNGAELGGGFDLGFQWGHDFAEGFRIGAIVSTGQQYGTSLVPERAIPAINENVADQQLANAAPLIGRAAANIPVPFVDQHARLDLGALAVVGLWLSFQVSVGAEHSHRYDRTAPGSAAGALGGGDVTRSSLPIGVAAEVDFNAVAAHFGSAARHVPFALVLEYQVAPTWARFQTVAEAAQHQEPDQKVDVCSQLVALGIHYTDAAAPDLDAALTGFYAWNQAPDASMISSTGINGASPYAFGGQLMARYLW